MYHECNVGVGKDRLVDVIEHVEYQMDEMNEPRLPNEFSPVWVDRFMEFNISIAHSCTFFFCYCKLLMKYRALNKEQAFWEFFLEFLFFEDIDDRLMCYDVVVQIYFSNFSLEFSFISRGM